jgi:hypothetical protein
MNPDLVRAGTARHAFAGAAVLSAALIFAGGAPRGAQAQLVTPKTVPVFQNQQFDILPSATAGMAGVSIALDDSLADPFVNPAKATRLRGGTFFTAPFRHSISDNRGGGRTLPVGGLASFGDWSIGGVFALQQLDRAGPMGFTQVISDRTATNQYLSLSLARRVGNGVSVGASGTFAGLGAVDGVDLLYAGSDHINQSGSSSDVRLGLTKEFAPHKTLEVILLHNQFQMTEDVHFRSWRYDPVLRQSIVTDRTDHNEDLTRIWGAHAEYTQPLGNEGWRIGWLATVNQLSNPKIPNYVLQSIPRDPGSTLAFNAGIGLARVFGGSTFGVDLIHEPMSSTTWADAAHDTAVVGGGIIPAGAKTVENSFRFANTMLRVGFGHEMSVSKDSSSMFGFQFGLGLYSINYRLGQTNNVQKTFREQRESWMEWTPTLGLALRMRSMELRYNYSVSCAVSECFSFGGDKVTVVIPPAATSTGGVIAAPSSPLTFNGGTASSHKFWISIPIR